jgi:two-component system phosphate regulon sensor histidine kinase PhoR
VQIGPFEIAILVGLLFGAGFLLASLMARRRSPMAPTESGRPVAAAFARRDPPVTDKQLIRLLDELEQGILRVDQGQFITWANRAADRLLGFEDGRLIGRTLMSTFLDHRVADTATEAMDKGASMIEVAQSDREERRMQLRFRASGDALWLFIEDVTELRRLQRIRSEFIDNLSHELRTPLTTIRLLTETLNADLARPDVDVPPRVRERVQKIDVETGHLAQMVTELLDLSRIVGGAAELHFASVSVSDLIDAAIERLRTFADRQRIGLEKEVAPDLPVVRGDEERLGQVLVNLLHNALKFSPSESVVTVGARLAEESGFVAVTVRDKGPGIARADLDRIFERFYKVDKARERGPGGTGLGLSIARHIVEGHGGRIWADSEEGRGSAFTFTVPLA